FILDHREVGFALFERGLHVLELGTQALRRRLALGLDSTPVAPGLGQGVQGCFDGPAEHLEVVSVVSDRDTGRGFLFHYATFLVRPGCRPGRHSNVTLCVNLHLASAVGTTRLEAAMAKRTPSIQLTPEQ